MDITDENEALQLQIVMSRILGIPLTNKDNNVTITYQYFIQFKKTK